MTGNLIVKKTATADFNLTETLYPPKLRQPRHSHQFASFSFVISGSYTEICERQTRTCQPLSLILHPPEEFHAVDFHNEPVRILNVRMDGRFLTRLGNDSNILIFPACCRSETIAALGNRLFREFCQPDTLSALAIEGLVLELLVETSRRRSSSSGSSNPKTVRKSSRWLNQAKEFLHDKFPESVALEEIAETVGVHPVHLARVFRRQFGCTIGEYLRLLRVEFVSRQLSATDLPLCEIALSAGFSDQSHLNKIFKNLVGLTPNEYRKFYRKG